MKTLVLILLLLVALYAVYSSFISVPLDSWVLVYFKYPGKLAVYTNAGYHFNVLNALPGNGLARTFPASEQECSFIFEKKMSVLEREFPLLSCRVTYRYLLDREKAKALYGLFSSAGDISGKITEELKYILSARLNTALENNYNLDEFIKMVPADIPGLIESRYDGIRMGQLHVQRMTVMPDLSVRSISDLLNRTKADLRGLELEKIRLQKQAENEVAYLRIVGEYIKENPLILRYLLIRRLDKNSVIMVPPSETGFDFSGSLPEKAMKNSPGSSNARSY